MDEERFTLAQRASRNGANQFFYQRMFPSFQYSDGVKECFEAGCYWILTILATELPSLFRVRESNLCVINIAVEGNQATITGEFDDMDTSPYTRHIDLTDLPEGDWKFYVAKEEGHLYRMILPSEY